MKILIIDDSNFTRNMLKRMISAMINNAIVFEAESGKSGIAMFDKEQPDLVLCDLLMNDLTGKDVVSYIRKITQTTFICIISSDIQRSTQVEVKQIGANHFIGKPPTPEKIGEMLKIFQERFSGAE